MQPYLLHFIKIIVTKYNDQGKKILLYSVGNSLRMNCAHKNVSYSHRQFTKGIQVNTCKSGQRPTVIYHTLLRRYSITTSLLDMSAYDALLHHLMNYYSHDHQKRHIIISFTTCFLHFHIKKLNTYIKN